MGHLEQGCGLRPKVHRVPVNTQLRTLDPLGNGRTDVAAGSLYRGLSLAGATAGVVYYSGVVSYSGSGRLSARPASLLQPGLPGTSADGRSVEVAACALRPQESVSSRVVWLVLSRPSPTLQGGAR